MTKLEAYETQISPLIESVARLCDEHDISFIATFQVDESAEGDHYRTSVMSNEDGTFPQAIESAMKAMCLPKADEKAARS